MIFQEYSKINLSSSSKIPLLRQAEASECGLACVGMVAGYFGYKTDMASLRKRFSISLKGTNLSSVIQIAAQLNLSSRAIKLDMESLEKIRLPAILHWNFNHFVVLQKAGSKNITIFDPATGIRRLSYTQAGESFTGVALELWPQPCFKKDTVRSSIKISNAFGSVNGLKRSLIQIFSLAFALEIFTVLNPFFLQWVIDNVVVTADYGLLHTLGIGFLLLLVLQQLTSFARSWAIMYMNTSLSIQLKSNIFYHLVSLPISYFEKRHLGDVVSRFDSVQTIQHTVTTSLIEAVLDGLVVIVTLIIMFIYSPVLATISGVGIIIYAIWNSVWYPAQRRVSEEQLDQAAKLQSHFIETLRGIRAIKLFQRQEARRSAWMSLLIDEINSGIKNEKISTYTHSFNSTLFATSNIVTIWLGGVLVINGDFTVGILVAFLAYKMQFDKRVSSLIDKLFDLRMLKLQGDRLSDIVLSEPENDVGEDYHQKNCTAGTIEVKNVFFSYSKYESPVLKNINFKICDGESVALVGASGGGKSTLVNILLDILQPTSGEIIIGGIETKKLGTSGLRKIIGTVLQDDTLFSGSISDNISFFDDVPNQDLIFECAFLAGVLNDINSMPMGFNTLVGDMGTVLSGGQKQRILLARALYKKPKILLLDEATSSLDIVKEKEVNNSISQLNITRLIVAHRPQTIASADRILILENGTLRCDDSVPQLMSEESLVV